MARFWRLFALLASVTLASCITVGSTRSCEEITLTALQPLMHETMPVEQVVEQIRAAYQLPLEAVTVNRIEALSTVAPWLNEKVLVGDVSILWGRDGVRYALTIRNQRVLDVSVVYDQRQPSIDDVIRCLGKPDQYWGYYSLGPTPLTYRVASLSMLFTASKFIVTASRAGRDEQPPRFDGSARVVMLQFLPQDPGEKLIARFLADWPSSMREQIAQQLRPWPEKWEDIVVEVPR